MIISIFHTRVLMNVFVLHTVSVTAFAFTHQYSHRHHGFIHRKEHTSVASTGRTSISLKYPQMMTHHEMVKQINDIDGMVNNGMTQGRLKKSQRGNKDEISQDIIVKGIGNRILNPNQIINPSYFPYRGSKNYNSSSIVESDKVTLHKALEELTKSMEEILQFESKLNEDFIDHYSIQKLEFILGTNKEDKIRDIFDFSMEKGYTDQSENKNIPWNEDKSNIHDNVNGSKDMAHTNRRNFFTIRVEQPLSHPVDPLCWLHANMKKSTSFSKSHHDLDNNGPAVIYFATAEKTMETAVYGSSYTIHNLNEYSEQNKKKSDNYSPWDLIQNLPAGARFYGGSRFDKDLDSKLMGDEWADFGKEMWILPGVELRRENMFLEKNGNEEGNQSNQSGSENFHRENQSNGIQEEVTTLSINLHFTSLHQLMKSANHVLSLLSKLSDDISPPVPDTTLPPIVSRGYNDNAQEVFEKGVNTALDMFEKAGKGASPLEKVVLARRSDLQFNTEVSGLDVMMKLKYGGSIGGHLFYMDPGKSAGKQFFGCTPERLFQVRMHDKKVREHPLTKKYF